MLVVVDAYWVWLGMMINCYLVLSGVFLGFFGWLGSSVDHVVYGAAYECVALVVHVVELG